VGGRTGSLSKLVQDTAWSSLSLENARVLSLQAKLVMESKNLVIGIDLGSSDSYVAYIGKGVVDIVQNEVSQRKTPTLVGFTDRERLLGDTALSQIKSNTKNTCRNFKHLLGHKFQSPSVEDEKFWATCPLAESEDGQAGFSVGYKGTQQVFTAVQVTAMFLTKLRDITEAWCQSQVADVVIGVPSYWSDIHRRALLDAADIAGMNVLRLMNEHTAIALAYGIYRTQDFDPEKPMTVAFCTMGHVIFSVAIVQFVRGKLSVLCEKSDKVGGRDMDECLMRTFAAQFQKKTGSDPLSNKKPAFKLEDAVTKTKKILSANSEAAISVECLMEDEDFASNINRVDFLEMCKPMMKKVNDVLEAAKAMAGLPPSAIDAVEMCGGASRVPWVKEMCSKAFGGKELSTTMNADECVARGCALQAAMMSPLYKVREFKVEDTSPFPISVSWLSPAPTASVEKTAVVLPAKSLMHLLKIMTFFRKESFELKVKYTDDKALLPGTPLEIGTYLIEVPAQAEPKKVKVKAVLTVHGTFLIQGAQLVEPEESPETVQDENMPDAAAATTAGDGQEKEQSEQRKRPGEAEATTTKKKQRRTDLTVKSVAALGLDASALKAYRDKEEAIQADMREIVEIGRVRNDLEAFILKMRGGLSEKYAPFVKPEERDSIILAFEKAEDWLYDHPDDGKEVVLEKLKEMKQIGDPVEFRFREASQRPELVKSLDESVRTYKTDPKYRKAAGLEAACSSALDWLKEMEKSQAAVPQHETPVLLCSLIEAKMEELAKLAAESPKSEPEAEVMAASTMDVD